MSGFASKLSAAGTKGWKDLQSLWSQSKTTLTSLETSPGEKSSLLSRSYGSGGESPKNQLLNENEPWGDWSPESDRSADRSTQSSIPNPDCSVCGDDDLEVWLNDESSTFSFNRKSSKKNSWNTNTKYTAVTSKRKEPLTGNLLDLEEGCEGMTTLSRGGCDNKGWTAIGQ
ncbi:unnamed protein product [Candidula unifasciata]|uniref:Uncharacterized protein n=1 Tax=Candidula unifasciata TaxID=100452 RepID=A0A8S3ZQK1_9EUPU|nr:unnamed protein product [Candidula unifasciata]